MDFAIVLPSIGFKTAFLARHAGGSCIVEYRGDQQRSLKTLS
jgi:hypothetical protein